MNPFESFIPQEIPSGNEPTLPQETFFSFLPLFDVLQNKHIPSKTAEIFGVEYFRLQPTTPVLNPVTPVNNISTTHYKNPTTYDPISNKELFPIPENKAAPIPVVERSKDYVPYQEVISGVVYQVWKPEHYITSTNWATVTIIGILLLVGYTRISLGKLLTPVLRAAFILNQASRIYFEKSVLISRLFGIIDFLFVATLGLLLTLAADYYGLTILELPYWVHFFIFSGVILILSVLKATLNRLMAYILNISDIVNEILFHSNLYTKLTALLYLPIAVLLPYVPPSLIEPVFTLLIFVGAILYLLRLIRLAQITSIKRFSNFHLFLYLCSVEIGPIVLVLSQFRQF